MKVVSTKLPADSVLTKDCIKYHYIDSFQGTFVDKNNTVTSQEIGKAFFLSAPSWIDQLFFLRNKIAGFIGLKTSGNIIIRQQLLDNFKCEPNKQLGLFKVIERTQNEVVLGEDDKHLNFRVSLFKADYTQNNKNLIISTTVEFNNWFGKLYFLLVRPFHKLIVPAVLKEIIKEIEKQNKN